MICNSKKTRINVLAGSLLTLSFLALTSCGEHKGENHIESANFTAHGDTIILTEKSNIRSRLTIHNVDEEEFTTEWNTAGIVKANPKKYAEIAPPFTGRIIKSFVKLGQAVSAGSPIFEINSPDYFNTQKEYFDAKQEFS